MADIRVPTLGESVTEATVGKWFKQPGDAVAVDEPLVELETDKVTLEVPAWPLPGHPEGCVTLHLGYGRTRAGRQGWWRRRGGLQHLEEEGAAEVKERERIRRKRGPANIDKDYQQAGLEDPSAHRGVLRALPREEERYHRTTEAPQVKPAPNATMRTLSPGLIRPCSSASSSARGMVTELMLP